MAIFSSLSSAPAHLRSWQALLRWLIALAALALAVWAEWGAPPVHAFLPGEWLRDAFLRMQVSTKEEPRVLVVDIDEASLARLGPWPWPRARIADLVEILLTRYEARGVALDIMLPDSADSAGDTRLALLARYGPVVPLQAFDFNRTRELQVRVGTLGGAVTAATRGVRATGYIGNYPALAAAPHVGAAAYITDADGVLRRVPLLTEFEGRQYPALALALIGCCSGQAQSPAPRLESSTIRVGFDRDWPAYTVVSAADILDGAIDPPSAAGRLVVVGSSSLGMADRVTTPFGADRPGLGVQANMLTTLLDRQAGLAPAPWPGRLIACIFALVTAFGATLAFPRLSALASVALLAASSLAWLVLAFFANRHDPDFSPAGPLATNLFLLAAAIPFQWQLAQRRSRHLLSTLRQYVAPAVVEELLRSEAEDPLKPRQLDVTTLIADMEGYTSQVEALPMAEGARLTRDFLDCLTGPVIETMGTLDKYTGDGLVAFWGAPLPIAGHADLALDAAREILHRVEVLSRRHQAAGHAPLRVRIGIESGPAMAGDFGTSFRSIYTAVGDSVNTASRLEQVARDFPHDVIIGAGAVERARRHQFILLGERRLRGKENPTILYTFESSMKQEGSTHPDRRQAGASLRESAR
ncbi:Adenylate cyclase 2 [Massilia sp. Bi118]|uniref:CHASE2 domain-containing protein n=1 Tax=Massilia sp. Bi118 TaxID=2822346 RepID=UPI001DF9A447|nr:adenylate/guanylate cyclase domain-containing protein [Massilia sp. Bi118]CAH0137625.1 Adenylate cyclase 2 [Massilia sp. Bi118]